MDKKSLSTGDSALSDEERRAALAAKSQELTAPQSRPPFLLIAGVVALVVLLAFGMAFFLAPNTSQAASVTVAPSPSDDGDESYGKGTPGPQVTATPYGRSTDGTPTPAPGVTPTPADGSGSDAAMKQYAWCVAHQGACGTASGNGEQPSPLPSPVGRTLTVSFPNGSTSAANVTTAAANVATGASSWIDQQRAQIAQVEAEHGMTPNVGGPTTSAAAPAPTASAQAGVMNTPIIAPQQYLLGMGTRIEVATAGNLDSSLAGPIIACALYDNRDPWNHALVIPRGACFIGQFTGLTPGADHMAIEWLWLKYPNRFKRPLTSTVTTGEEGESGISGRVNTHLWQQFRNTVVLSVANSAGTILQSALSKASGQGVYVNGNSQPITVTNGSPIVPTLYVDRTTEFSIVLMGDYTIKQPYTDDATDL